MPEKVLERYRRCAFCDLAAIDDSSLCRTCLDEVEHDNEVANFQWCNVCGGELNHRGYCFTCIRGSWSDAQVRDEVSA